SVLAFTILRIRPEAGILRRRSGVGFSGTTPKSASSARPWRLCLLAQKLSGQQSGPDGPLSTPRLGIHGPTTRNPILLSPDTRSTNGVARVLHGKTVLVLAGSPSLSTMASTMYLPAGGTCVKLNSASRPILMFGTPLTAGLAGTQPAVFQRGGGFGGGVTGHECHHTLTPTLLP